MVQRRRTTKAPIITGGGETAGIRRKPRRKRPRRREGQERGATASAGPEREGAAPTKQRSEALAIDRVALRLARGRDGLTASLARLLSENKDDAAGAPEEPLGWTLDEDDIISLKGPIGRGIRIEGRHLIIDRRLPRALADGGPMPLQRIIESDAIDEGPIATRIDIVGNQTHIRYADDLILIGDLLAVRHRATDPKSREPCPRIIRAILEREEAGRTTRN